MAVCPKCGWWEKMCHCTPGEAAILTDDWVRQGEWEHIDPKLPHLRIDSKRDLIRECEKRGLMPKALMKPKSQGRGWEIRRRGI